MSQYYIGSKEIIFRLEQEKIDVEVHNVEDMNNWEYEDVVSIDYKEDDIKKQIELGKICTYEVSLKNKYQAGMQQYRENGMFYTDLWLDTSKLSFLDNDKINEVNRNFYDKITQIAIKNQKNWQWKCVGIGVETYIECKESLQEMIYCSRNISRWILEKGIVDSLVGYSKEATDNIQIYSKY